MPAIPRTQQYYPSVPLSELSDLYSKGDNRLNGHKVFIISYLPKVLRVRKEEPKFNNKYLLFIENTIAVDSISWEYKFYLNNQVIVDPAFIDVSTPSNRTEFDIGFIEHMVDGTNKIVYDKLVISCRIVLGAADLTLSIQHTFIEGLNSALGLNGPPGVQPIPIVGDPVSTNIVVNLFEDYFLNEFSPLKWNGVIVENNPDNLDALLKATSALLYPFYPNPTQFLESYFFNLNDYVNLNIKAFLNHTEPNPPLYEGDYTNGLLHIPLHILNYVLEAIGTVPVFDPIADNNPILNMLETNEAVPLPGLEEQARILEAKRDLANRAQLPRLVELFNLTLFPKSAIKLAAILLKYLFQCSKKNNCEECLNKSAAWMALSFGQLKDNQDFLKNILTHYFSGPSNKIQKFSQKADQTNALAWSPAIHAILNVAPRITKAYFAKKVVKRISENIGGAPTDVHIFEFERIDATQRIGDQPAYDSILGKKVYLVIETLHCRNKQITANIQTNDNRLTGNTGDTLSLLSGRNDTSTADANYPSNIQRSVGNFDDLKNNSDADFNVKEIEYFKIDHQDKAIVKLRIKPQNRVDFQGDPDTVPPLLGWTTRLVEGTAHLRILARMTDNTPAFFGNNITEVRANAEFLNLNDPYVQKIKDNDIDNIAFRLINRIVYEIYHRDNEWNPLSDFEGVTRTIGKIDNVFIQNIADGSPLPVFDSRKTVFSYLDQSDNEHYVAECSFFKARRRRNGFEVHDNSNIANVPIGFTSDQAAPAGGDAFWNYYYANEDIVTRDNPAAGGTDYGIIRYRVASADLNDLVELVRMPDTLNITFDLNGNLQRIIYTFTNTQRRYANPGCFAAFVGVLAQLSYDNVQSTGMCFEDATSYPSLEHPNGDSIDTVYLETQAKRHAIIAAFRQWRFTRIISGSDAIHDGDGAHDQNDAHNNHLHSGNFNVNSVENMI